jgi:hypothetical protein
MVPNEMGVAQPVHDVIAGLRITGAALAAIYRMGKARRFQTATWEAIL